MQLTWTSCSPTLCVCAALPLNRQIRAGDEISLTYGTHDNHNLLLSYGFTLQPNPYDGFYFDLNMETIEVRRHGW